MRYIKTYEKTTFYTRDKNKKFEVGDKVFVIPNPTWADDLKEFLTDNIGTIYSEYQYQRTIGDNDYRYFVQYKNIPKNIKEYMDRDDNDKRTLCYLEKSQLKLATPFDIEQYNIRNITKNYNL